ncbi:hypothetical protein [Streptomyces sp. NEAU-174]|uniref:hypothetical protein n=1 Tax=Streptomyces sp. NEAU-174 TaxID=3458254 RepID=UPI0040439C00
MPDRLVVRTALDRLDALATISHTYTSAAGFTVTATYDGGPSFLSSSGTDAQTVHRAATTTAVVSSPNPSLVSDPVTVTTTVSPVAPGAGTPTGLTADPPPRRAPPRPPRGGGTSGWR